MVVDTETEEPPGGGTGAAPGARALWHEDGIGTPRLPDPVRSSAVRAGLAVAFALIAAMVAVLGTLAGTWIAAPAALVTVLGTVLATWAVVDVWVTRQVWNQRAGVVSGPSSAARALRRQRRRRRRAAARSGGHRRSGHLISRA